MYSAVEKDPKISILTKSGSQKDKFVYSAVEKRSENLDFDEIRIPKGQINVLSG